VTRESPTLHRLSFFPGIYVFQVAAHHKFDIHIMDFPFTVEEDSKYLIRAQQLMRAKSLSVDLDAAKQFQVPPLTQGTIRVSIFYISFKKKEKG
jgi:hypothetical protein